MNRRPSNRLYYWDYSQPGWYFLTFCTHHRACLFGDVRDSRVHLSTFGQIALEELQRSVALRAELTLDEHVIMPNHIHLIAVLGGKDTLQLGYARGQLTREPRSVSTFIGGAKGRVTTRINALRATPGDPVWQRNFHDHIIRTDWALQRIREYIRNNPAQWEVDHLHPSGKNKTDELEAILRADARHPL